jgi:hypothetical protein
MDDLNKFLLLKMAREDGYQAYQDGLTQDDNPHDNGDGWEQQEAWREGFYEAGWDD